MSQYIITDGSRFIYRNHSGKYVPTSSEAMADIFTKKQADGIYKNSLPKALRTIFRVEKYASKELKICRVKRRSVKNELAVINIILSHKMEEIVGNEIYQKI